MKTMASWRHFGFDLRRGHRVCVAPLLFYDYCYYPAKASMEERGILVRSLFFQKNTISPRRSYNFKWQDIYVGVNFLSQVIFVFLLFLGMVMLLMKLQQRKNKNYPRQKNQLQHISLSHSTGSSSYTLQTIICSWHSWSKILNHSITKCAAHWTPILGFLFSHIFDNKHAFTPQVRTERVAQGYCFQEGREAIKCILINSIIPEHAASHYCSHWPWSGTVDYS